MIAFILSLDSSFIISGSTTDSKKYMLQFLVFCIAAFSLTAYRVIRQPVRAVQKCTVKGAIVRANRKKSEAWVESGKERRSPDLARPDPKLSRFITPPLLSCRVAFRFVLLYKRLERASNNNSN